MQKKILKEILNDHIENQFDDGCAIDEVGYIISMANILVNSEKQLNDEEKLAILTEMRLILMNRDEIYDNEQFDDLVLSMKLAIESQLLILLTKNEHASEIRRCILLEIGWILMNLTNLSQASSQLFSNLDQSAQPNPFGSQPMLAQLFGRVLKSYGKDQNVIGFYLTTITNLAIDNQILGWQVIATA